MIMEGETSAAEDGRFLITSEVESKLKINSFKGDPLTSKEAVELLLNGTLRYKVCRYCLNVTCELRELNEILVLAGKDASYEISVKDIIASFHPFKVDTNTNFLNKICTTCLDKALSCYFFTQQCEQAERALRNYFEDIDEKFNKLDPLEPVKKRGKKKQNPNYNVLHAEHYNVIDYAEPVINIVNLNALPVKNTEINDLECPKCWQILPNKFLLINHVKSHPKTMWYHCRLCGKSFVKISHLRRHFRSNHINDETVEQKKEFQCNECGIRNTVLSNHLQHMDKHKFKSVLDGLIKRDSKCLCAICLEKGPILVDLKETMHFHGGYAELSGQRSISNIASSVLPNNKTNKYQELIIPRQATILRILKRKSGNTDKTAIKKNKYSDEMDIFSKPIIVSNVAIDADVSFVFSKPDAILITLKDYNCVSKSLNQSNQMISDNAPKLSTNPIEITRNIGYAIERVSSFLFSNPDYTTMSTFERNGTGNISQEIWNNDRNVEENIDFENNIFVFSIPDSNYDYNQVNERILYQRQPKIASIDKCEVNSRLHIDDDYNKELHNNGEVVCENNVKLIINDPVSPKNVLNKTLNSCKVCWIFAKSNCSTCILKTVVEDGMKKHIQTEITCKFCYMFCKVGCCGICGKSNTLSVSEKLIDENERKSNEIYLNSRTDIWKCFVCLTENINSETCLCCDQGRQINKSKTNLNNQTFVLKSIETKEVKCAYAIETGNKYENSVCEDKNVSELHIPMETELIHSDIELIHSDLDSHHSYIRPDNSENRPILYKFNNCMDIDMNEDVDINMRPTIMEKEIDRAQNISNVPMIVRTEFNVGTFINAIKKRKIRKASRR